MMENMIKLFNYGYCNKCNYMKKMIQGLHYFICCLLNYVKTSVSIIYTVMDVQKQRGMRNG